MIEKITQALVSAYKRDHEGVGDNVTVEANEEKGTVRMRRTWWRPWTIPAPR